MIRLTHAKGRLFTVFSYAIYVLYIKKNVKVISFWLTWSKNKGSFCIQSRGDNTKRNTWKSETPLRQQSWVSWPRHRYWCCERLLLNDNVTFRTGEVKSNIPQCTNTNIKNKRKHCMNFFLMWKNCLDT